MSNAKQFDIKRILKSNNFYSLSGNIVFAILGFVSYIILVRGFATKSDFGEWVLYITSATFVEMLRFGVIKLGMVRFLSGANKKEGEVLIGSNWVISIVVTIFIALLIYVAYILFPEMISKSGFKYFFIWYPILTFVNLPMNNALSVLQAKMQFGNIFFLRSISLGGFVVFLSVYYFMADFNIEIVIRYHLIIFGLSSIFAMFMGWTGSKYLFKAKKESIKKLLRFGSFSVGSFIGSNLLKSSDTFIIGLSSLGTHAVALYYIPLKLIEIIEIPLRSFAATTFPLMAKVSIENKTEEVRELFYKYAGLLTILLIPVLIGIIVFAEFLVSILGGSEYVETANILRIFAIYGLFLPIDRFTGVALDSVNRPEKNLVKICFMVAANILGDILVIALWDDILPVAIVTISTAIIGVGIGYYYLKKYVDMNFFHILLSGWKYIVAYFFTIKAIVNSKLQLFHDE